MSLDGGTNLFKIFYKSVSMMYLLPKPNSNKIFFVIGLDTPIRLTTKPIYYLVFEFEKTDTIKKKTPLKINLTQEEIDTLYPDKGNFNINLKVFQHK